MNPIQKSMNYPNLVMIIPLLFALMPRPPISGTQYLTYPIIGIVSAYLIIYMAKRVEFDQRVLMASSFLLLLSFSITLSVAFSELVMGLGVFVHIFKPLMFIMILLFGYFIASSYSLPTIIKGLLKAAYIILILQVVVGITQLYAIPIFDIVYTSEKTRPLGHLVRIAGTLGNPNIFAWIVIQMAMIIFLFETKKFKKTSFILIALTLVFFSGSRSLLCLFPVMLLCSKLFLDKKNVVFYFTKIPKYFLLFGSFMLFIYWFLKTYGQHFPYLNQLLVIVETGSLSSVNSFDARTIMWDNALNQMDNGNSVLSWIFGLGAGAIGVLDNDFLYTITNYGILGLIVNISFYLFLYFQFSKLKYKKFAVLGQIYIIFSFILGYQADTLSGWNYPILIMFYAGICIALRKPDKVKEIIDISNLESIKKKKRLRITW